MFYSTLLVYIRLLFFYIGSVSAGDVTPDARAIASADVIVTTPEKWDGISRSWQTRSYVRAVALIVIDEIHLLGEDRGPVLEVIVSRTNFIASHTSRSLRVVGLSTALANAKDLANWLNIGQASEINCGGLYYVVVVASLSSKIRHVNSAYVFFLKNNRSKLTSIFWLAVLVIAK